MASARYGPGGFHRSNRGSNRDTHHGLRRRASRPHQALAHHRGHHQGARAEGGRPRRHRPRRRRARFRHARTTSRRRRSRAIRAGETKYTAVDGTPALKQAICAKFKRENGLDYKPDEITVGTGGKQVLYNALMATLNAGRRGRSSRRPTGCRYPDMVLLAGGTPVLVPCPREQRLQAARRGRSTRRSRRRPSG